MQSRGTCPNENVIVDLLASSLHRDAQAAVKRHIDSCDACRQLMSDAKRGMESDLVSAILHAGALATDCVLAGRYRIVRFVGRGGMGEVYEAYDLELGERVAIKILKQDIADDPRMAARLKREVQLARKVTHPNVCRVFDVGYHHADGQRLLFLTMELLSGETLRQHLQRAGRLSADQALPIVVQLADALAAAHAAGVIHRDLKSDNVMLLPAPSGVRAVVTDFGLACAALGSNGKQSSSGLVIGTAAYMAPEQVEAAPITPSVDVYALGIVMFELVTGALPFQGGPPSAVALRRLHERAPSPRKLVPTLSATWETTIARCLARAPTDRFAGPHEIIQALVAPASPRRQRMRTPLAVGGAIWLAVAVGAVSRVRPPSGTAAPTAKPRPYQAESANRVPESANRVPESANRISESPERISPATPERPPNTPPAPTVARRKRKAVASAPAPSATRPLAPDDDVLDLYRAVK
jgi:serine/threonine protein kinase